jgi:hypothetical protein
VPEAPEPESVFERLTRLVKLEFELGLAETRVVIKSALIAVAVAVPAAIALIASIVVLLAGAFAPLFDASWEHFLIAGGGIFLLAAIALAWSAYRLTHLQWPRETLTSVEETWRWLAAQVRSRLTSNSRAV